MGEVHRALGDLHLDDAGALHAESRGLHALHGRLARRVHGLGEVGQLHVLALLLHGRAHRAARGVDEAGPGGQAQGLPAGVVEQGEVPAGQVGHEDRVGRQTVPVDGADRRAHQGHVDVVAVHPPLHVDPDHAPAPGLGALGVDAFGGPGEGPGVGRRGVLDLALAPVPHVHRDGVDGDPTDQFDRLPADGVEDQLLVDGEVGQHPGGLGRPLSARSRPADHLGGPDHLGLQVDGLGSGQALANRSGHGHRSRTVGTGAGMGSKSLKRRTRLPRRMHWSSASP